MFRSATQVVRLFELPGAAPPGAHAPLLAVTTRDPAWMQREEEQRLKESRTELAETPAAKMALKWRRLAAGSTRAREAQKTHPGWSAVSRLVRHLDET